MDSSDGFGRVSAIVFLALGIVACATHGHTQAGIYSDFVIPESPFPLAGLTGVCLRRKPSKKSLPP